MNHSQISTSLPQTKPVRFFPLLICVMASITMRAQAQDDPVAVKIEIEKASDLAGPWEKVPTDLVVTGAEASLVEIVEGGAGFFRLQIKAGEAVNNALGIPLEAIPDEVRTLASDHLESLRTEEPDWAAATLSPIVVPVFDPAFKGGIEPAYYEFKVVGLSPQPEPPDQPAFGLSDPLDVSPNRGYILVAAGRHDVPIPQYATEGLTRSEHLRFLAGETLSRIVRYSAGFWVAEDEAGALRASIGSTPYRMPAEFLDYKGALQGTEILNGDKWQDSFVPPIEPSAYESYGAFRDDYSNGPVYAWLRTARAKMAALSWAAIDNVEPPTVRIPTVEDTLVLPDIQVKSYELLDSIAAGWIEPEGGLWLNGSLDGITEMIVIDTGGDVHYFVLVVGEPIQVRSWSSWTTIDALGSCSWLPRYTQENGLAGCCSDGASGCGPTAWAIFYGFWDYYARDLIGGTGRTPQRNNSDVQFCIQRTFDLTGCWCTGIGGQAATNPWQMADGAAYAAERGVSITMSSNWCIPYTSYRPRRRAYDAIAHADLPAIVGTGWWAHYPVAYAYRQRTYRAFGITWSTQVQWKVYMGWGGNTCEWVDGNSCWFGMNANCF